MLDQSANHWYFTSLFKSVAQQYFALSKPGRDATVLKQFIEERQAETLARRNVRAP